MEPADARRLLAVADETPYGALINLALLTGLRLSELLGLRWQDVDLERGALQVRQTCQWLAKQGFVFRPPKTYRSIRPVALAQPTMSRLRQHRVKQMEERLGVGAAYQDHGLVFVDAVGRPIHPSTLRSAWKRIVRGAGLSNLRFHDLRHAHATLLLQQGVHPKIVSERLGHSTVNITLDVYSHVTPTLQAEAAGKVAELFT